jgi:hypothetical protein
MARRALDLDPTPVGLDDAVNHRQPQAGAVNALGGEEGLEDASERDLVHADSLVGDPQDGPSAARLVRRSQGDAAARRHGVASVDDQVEDDLLDAVGVGADGREFGVELQFDRVVLPGRPAQGREQVGEQGH